MTHPVSGPRPAASVCAVVVTFNPDQGALARQLAATLEQVAAVIVIDNGSCAEAVRWLAGQACAGRLRLVTLDSNQGLAAALNRGIDLAVREGYAHILLMDHDSVPSPDMVRRLLEAHRRLAGQGRRIAAVGPRYRDPRSGRDAGFIRFGARGFKHRYCMPPTAGQYLEADILISSGALIPSRVLQEIGGMDEGLFIDLVDTEWCLRARAKGYELYGICDAVMEHELGQRTARLWLGRWRHIPVHSPQRYYYMFRNSLLLYRRPYAPYRWILGDALKSALLFAVCLLAAPPRAKRLRMVARGVRDGIEGRTGRMREPAVAVRSDAE